jgi:chromosome segregation ATPase
MKCPYCNEDLKEWDGRFYCANMLCPAKQEDLPKFIWQDLIDGKKAQHQLRTVKDRCVKKVKAKEREIDKYFDGISVRQSENERLARQLKQAQDALDVAKEALNDIQFTDDGNQIVDIRTFAHHAYDQINKALEQKDVK